MSEPSSSDTALADKFGSQPPDITTELESMLRMFNLEAEDLYYKWDSYVFKMGADTTQLTLDTVRDFKRDTQDALEKEMRGRARMQAHGPEKKTPRPNRAMQRNGGDMMVGLRTPTTPASGMKRKLDLGSSPLSVSTPSRPVEKAASVSSTPFKQRPKAGETLEVLNDHLPKHENLDVPTDKRVTLTANVDPKKFGYRPMHQKLTEVAEVHDDRIDEYAAIIQDHYSLPDDVFTDPSMSSPDEKVAVGRIVSDSLEGKLNQKSILLECSRRMSAGARVSLRLDNLSSYSFFPGQVVAVRGINASGQYFVVSEILELPRLPPAVSTVADLKSHAERLSSGGLSIMIASGPYTTDDNLDFEALDVFCTKAAETGPDVVILFGPFIDAEHPLVEAGDFDLETVDELNGGTLEDLFRERISSKIKRIQKGNVLLIPSLRDAVSKHLAFPQEPIKRHGNSLELPRNARSLPNPAIFSLNEIVFGICSVDILFHLSREEVSKAPAMQNVPSRLTSHVITQRNFYPLFPPPPRDAIPRGMQGPPNLDVPYSRLADFIGVTPDVLILPSGMMGFAKVVDGVVVVNPGSLSKRMGAGTWAEMTVKGWEGEDGKDEVVTHKVYERARVEVAKI